MASIQTLQKMGTDVYPQTVTSAVFDTDGTVLKNIISDIKTDISTLSNGKTDKPRTIYKEASTDPSGNVLIESDNSQIIISALVYPGYWMAIPFYHEDNWYVKIISVTNNAQAPENTNVKLYIRTIPNS